MELKNKYHLFSFLDTIGDEEFYRLKRYVYSDFFNTNERLKKLFDKIWTAKTGKDSYRDIDPVAVYQSAFPKEGIGGIRDDFSAILKLVRQFIAQEEYQNDTQAKTRYLLKGLENRKAHRKFRTRISKESKKYTGAPNRIESREAYLHDLLIAENRYQYYNIYENRKPATNQMLQEFADSIDRFHAILKIKLLGIMKRRDLLMGYAFDYGNIAAVQETVQTIPPGNFPLLHLYYNMYLLWENESFEQFDTCKSILLKYQERFSLYEQKQLFQGLINYCRFKVMTDKQPRLWNIRQLALYEQFFESGFCYTGKNQRKQQISLHHYKNYMQLLVELDYFEQFESLQEKYGHQVYFKNEAQKNFVHQYNTTALYFAQHLYRAKNKQLIGQEFAYETALRHIQKIEEALARGEQEYPDPFYKILYEVLLLKIYFEEPKGFLQRRSSFYKYVNNQKQISSVFRESYLNFVRIALLLYKLKSLSAKDAASVESLSQEIASKKTIEREWLNERLMAML